MKEIEIYSMNDFQRFINAETKNILKNGTFKPFVLTIKAIKDRVSRQQQKFIYGVLYPNIKQGLLDTGHESVKQMDNDDLDYLLRQMFYYKTVATSKGEQRILKRLSFGLGKKEDVICYIDSLLRFAAQIGVYIEAPQDDWYLSKGE